MGIPFYFWSICKKYPDIISTSLPCTIDSLFIDFNGAIHPAVRKVVKGMREPMLSEDIEPMMHDEIWRSFKGIVAAACPQKRVGIFIDGVAPVAKMIQQRKRRYLSQLRSKMLNQKVIWDTNAISPGTSFMSNLHLFLEKGVTKLNRDPAGLRYELCSSKEPGEGEHKIFQRLQEIPDGDKTVIHGLDADLIMLSLLSHRKNIFLMREDDRQPGVVQYLSIDALHTGIMNEIRQSGFPLDDQEHDAMESYIVACFVLGNDFLPHPSSLSLKKDGHAVLLESWMAKKELLIRDGTIQWDVLSDLIRDLSKKERERLLDYNKSYMERPLHLKQPEDRVEAYPRLHQNMHIYSKSLYNGTMTNQPWRPLYYKNLFRSRVFDTRVIQKSCMIYLRGIQWVYHYYKRMTLDSMWYYPYAYAPALEDLANYLDTHVQTLEAEGQEWRHHPTPMVFVSPEVQLLSILPIGSKSLLPEKLQKLMTEPKHGLTYMYPENFTLETFLKTYLWECEPMLPSLSIASIQNAVALSTQNEPYMKPLSV